MKHVPNDRIAEYFDRETDEVASLESSQHIDTCVNCSAILRDMALTRDTLAMLPTPRLPDLWVRVERAFTPTPLARVRRERRVSRVAATVCAVLLVGALAFIYGRQQLNTERESFGLPTLSVAAPFDFGWYVGALDHTGRLPTLPANFERRRVSMSEALAAANIDEDLNPQTLPASLTLVDAVVISRGAFNLAQLTFRDDRGEVLIFCQPRSSPVWFGSFPVTTATVGSRRCLSVYCGKYQALSLSTQNGTYTVVGHRDNTALGEIVQSLSVL